MDIGKTLYFFRKNRQLKQREVFQHTNASVYSKIESNKQELRVQDLLTILETLSVTPEEFLDYAALDQKQTRFRELFQACSENPAHLKKKEQLLKQLFPWSLLKDMTIQNVSNHVAIQVFFSAHWEEVAPLTNEQLTELFQLLITRPYFFQYDYILLSNILFLLREEQADRLLKKAFPMKDEQLRNDTTKKFIKSLFNNLITVHLHKENYTKAHDYLTLAKEQAAFIHEMDYKVILFYLENVLNYLLTGRYLFLKKVYDCIAFLKDVGEQQLAQNIEFEVESLTLKKGNFPMKATANTILNQTKKRN